VQGEPATALERMDHSRVGESAIDLAWIAPGTSLDLVRELVHRLAPGGVVVCPVDDDVATALERLRAVTPGCVTQRLGTTGLIVATREA